MEKSSCFVSGGMCWFLRLARLAGLAPLRLQRDGAGWRAALSRRWQLYGHVMIAIFNTITMMAVARELQLPPEATVRMRSQTRKVVWFLQALFMAVVSSVAVCAAPAHTRDMIATFNHVKKINAELNIDAWPPSLRGRAVSVLVSQAVVCVIFSVVNYVETNAAAYEIHEEVWINGVSCFYFFTYWIVQVRNVLFIVTVLHVRYSFVVVNNHLKHILQDLENSKNAPDPAYILKDIKNITHQLNNFFGFGNIRDTVPDDTKPPCLGTAHTSVRRLARVYGALCSTVRGVDRVQGGVVLLLLATFLLHLVCTPYFFITYLLDDESQANLTPLNIVAIANQLMWCCYHTINLVVIVEPCHLTHYEMVRTRSLVARLTSVARAPGPLAAELDQFFRYLALNQVYYEPMHFARMTRSLIFTLLGSITTYTVVILHM